MKIKVCILIIILIIFSCNKKKRITVITDLTKGYRDTLYLKKDYHYSSYYISVKGYTNDTVKINDYYFFGKFDTVIRKDFYGNKKSILVLEFKPYKGNNGEIKMYHYAN